MSLILGFAWRGGHCPVVLMKRKEPFRLTSERLFAVLASVSTRQMRENAPEWNTAESDGYFAASVAFAAAARSVALPVGEPIAWNSNAVSLSRALS
ncbi:MAG: hypothetical protein JWR14_6679 [Caballeronia sp.]|nr:hypothetical protein [Caballeronia sp.]